MFTSTVDEKLTENSDFIRLLSQSLTNLAIIYAVAIWLVICTIGRANKTILSLYQVDGQSKHAQKRNT